MDLLIKNGIKPCGCVNLPPSKSEAIRAALLYALAGEDPRLAVGGFPPPYCTDVEDALNAAQHLMHAYVGASAALMRFMIPIQAALYGRVNISADEVLYRRGLREAEECLGVSLTPTPGTDSIDRELRLAQNRYEIDCSRSSQFLSGLMIALPLLKHECEIVIKNGLVSGPYAEMTFGFVKAFGGDIERTDRGFITRPSVYRAPESALVSGDSSYAAVFEAMNLLGGEIMLLGKMDGMQPDSRFLMISSLPVIDVSDCPDLMPILAAAACGKAGDTVITGTARLSTKESDRPKAIETLIRALGGSAERRDDRLMIHGSGWLRGGRCSACGDHRIAFAAAAASLLCREPVVIEGAECVKKSAFGFWEDMERIGFELCRM